MKLIVGNVASNMTGRIVSLLTWWRIKMVAPILFVILGLESTLSRI